MKQDEKAVKKVLKYLVKQALALFEKKLIACYVIGEPANATFEANLSHIPVCLILKDPFDEFKYEKLVEQLKQSIRDSHLTYVDRVNISYTTLAILESTSGYRRLSSFDKLDLIEKGHCLYGKDIRKKLTKPNQLDMAIEGVSAFFSLNDIDHIIHDIKNLPELVKEGRIKKITNLILWPTRFIYTAQTQQLAPSVTAVQYFLKHCSELDKVNLVKWAYAMKQMPAGSNIRDAMKQYVTLGSPVDSLVSLYSNFLTLYQKKLKGGQDPVLNKKIEIALKKLESTSKK